MNKKTTNQPAPSAFERKVGFFGSVKKLGVTTVAGANTVVIDSVDTITGITGSTAIVSGIVKEATSIWGESLLEDLRADQSEDRLMRELDMLQRKSELDRLKTLLAEEKKKAGTK